MIRKPVTAPAQTEIPIQPVAKPILCGPFAEPDQHWVYDTRAGEACQEAGRRPASYWYKTQRTGSAQMALLAEEECDDPPLVNLLREDVRHWRAADYRNATPVTRQLLRYWSRADRPRRLFFCQREATETVIYLHEILNAGRHPGFKPKLPPDDFRALIPQVYRIVDEYIARKVDFRGCHPCELGLETYVRRIVERLTAAIEPDADSGEPPLLPRLNRYQPIGSTAGVNFKTTRPCVPTVRSHIDQVVADTDSWEQAAVFRLEQAGDIVAFYARNDHLELSIPYEYLGAAHSYFPDFVVRLTGGLTLLLEIKGEERERDRAKHQAAQRWVRAVNHWGQLGQWAFHACRDPQRLSDEIRNLLKQMA